MSIWYVARDGQSTGPLSVEQVQQMARAGELKPADLVFQAGMSNWVPAGSVAGLFPTQAGAAAPAGPGSLAGLAHMALRAFPLDLAAVVPTEAERTVLEARGLAEPPLPSYLVWRRSALLVVLVVGSITAVIGTVNQIIGIVNLGKAHLSLGAARADFPSSLTAIGWAVAALTIVALWGLPGSALLGFARWAQPRLSRNAVLWGAAVSFLLPMLLALVPVGWQIEMEGVDDEERTRILQVVGVVVGFVIFFTLMPLVLALVAGVAGSALRVKSVVPASTTPGLFLAGASYLQALMLFILLVTVHLVASNIFLVLGTLLWVGAPLVYVLGAGRLVPSLSAAEAARHIRTLRAISGALVGVSSVLFVVYLTTTELFGYTLVPHLLSPWKLLEMLLSYTGRLLFIGVLGLDVLLRVDLAVWFEGQRFAATPEAAEHARLMERLRQGLEGADAAGQ